jgi:mannose-6-phosphate isomerase
MDALHAAAMTHGLAADGLIVDELSSRYELLKPSRRLWPHTEAIKAAATRHAAGDAEARRFAEAMAAALLRQFLDQPFSGGWIDHRSADGAPLVDYVPASSLYHLALAASVADKGFVAAPALAGAMS